MESATITAGPRAESTFRKEFDFEPVVEGFEREARAKAQQLHLITFHQSFTTRRSSELFGSVSRFQNILYIILW